MDITQLRTLIHVAELGSLSKAADRLHIAQPALSRQMRMLEKELGVQLFDRHGRGMIVTDAGRDVLRHAQQIMIEMEEIRASVGDEDAPLRGHVSIGMPPTVSDIMSVPLVKAISSRHPEATIRIVAAYSAYLLDWLHRGDLDVAILFETRLTRSLRSTPLLEEVLCLIGPPESGLRQDAPVSFEMLGQRKLLLPSQGNGLRTIVEQCACETGTVLDVRIEADNFSTLKDLVRSGHGLTILPLAPLHDEISKGQLSWAPLCNPVPSRQLMLSHPSDRPMSRLARFAAHNIVSTAEQLIEGGIWSGKLLSGRDIAPEIEKRHS
jgi:LysR family transcriptional regulator, nitrogen assimilation regulatory protein